MGHVGDLVGYQGAAAAGMVGPAEHAGFEEGAVDDQLAAALEQVEQARFALGPVELVLLLHGQPWHPPALGGQRVTGAGHVLLLHEQLLARSLPLLRRHDRGCLHCEMSAFRFVSSAFLCYALTGSAATSAESWRSNDLAAPLRQLSAMDCDMGSGKMSSSPFSTPPKMARATDSGEAFGMSRSGP